MKLNNITLLPSVGEKRLIEILTQCDVGLISLSKKLKTENIPGKLLSYCQAGLPTLASINKSEDLKKIIIESNCGMICENGDDKNFYDNVLTLFNSPEMINTYGGNTNSLLKKYFDVHSASKQILSQYK